MDETDRDLISKYREGDISALETLVEKYRRPLFGYIVNMAGNRADADEIFQEAWFRVIRGIGSYRHSNFLGWLMRIARNIVIDRSRRKKPDLSLDQEREEGGTLAEVIPGSDPGPSREVEAGELKHAINEAVAELPGAQKEVFIMRVWSGLSFKEIAGIQRVSINTALARMQYAITKLRPKLEPVYRGLK